MRGQMQNRRLGVNRVRPNSVQFDGENRVYIRIIRSSERLKEVNHV